MAIRKIILLLFIVISISIYSSSTYKLISLENEEISVCVDFDEINNFISINLDSKNKICIDGFKELIDIKVSGNKFLLLNFSIRGGSGVQLIRTAIICVSNGKIFKSLDILSSVHSFFNDAYNNNSKIDDEENLYQVALKLVPEAKSNQLILQVNENEMVKSKGNPLKNKTEKEKSILYFNNHQKIFQNNLKALSGKFEIDDGKSDIISREFKDETYPAIIFRNYEYYFIDDSWYIKDQINHLTKFSNSCIQ